MVQLKKKDSERKKLHIMFHGNSCFFLGIKNILPKIYFTFFEVIEKNIFFLYENKDDAIFFQKIYSKFILDIIFLNIFPHKCFFNISKLLLSIQFIWSPVYFFQYKNVFFFFAFYKFIWITIYLLISKFTFPKWVWVSEREWVNQSGRKWEKEFESKWPSE